MVLKQEGVREISKGIKKFQGFRDENCGILQSTSSGGRELKALEDYNAIVESGRPPREVVN